MARRPITWVVAVDGGTTNTRARLLHDGRVVAAARRPVGVRDAVISAAGVGPLAGAVRDAVADVLRDGGGVRPDAIVAAGMLSSEAGLAAVPHVEAPAGVAELAAAARLIDLPGVAPQPILFVPGVRTPPGAGPDGWAEADVMRGEECETLGALELIPRDGPLAVVWPGSHTKLVAVDGQGRIARSQTTLAGEMMSAVARQTILAASLPAAPPDDPDPAALAAGGRLVAREGLGRCAFLVRVAALTGAMTPEERAAFWLGAVVADDAAHLARHPILAGEGAIWVGGRPSLRRAYAGAIGGMVRGPVRALPDDDADRASALGALAVARRALRP